MSLNNLYITKYSGWCFGIINIEKKIKLLIKKNKSKKFYVLKNIVHNKLSNEYFFKKYKIKLINSIDQIKDKKNSILILQAHGSDKKLIDYLKQNKINFCDMVCPLVQNISNQIIKNNCKKLFFIGKKDHDETKYILSNNPKIKLFKNQKITSGAFITNQSTFNYEKINQLYKKYNQNKNITFHNGCCSEVIKRQEEIKNKSPSLKQIFVCGDKNSNNCLELVKIAKKHTKNIFVVSNKNELKKMKINKNIPTGIFSSTSISKKDFNDIVNFISIFLNS